MRTAGIICEYNPFHQGHRFQIQETRRKLGEDTALICVMSGNYVQRGQPALYDKWIRAENAVCGGADLVIELPITKAVSSAGHFAAGAVDCMAALGCVDVLSFGSESGDLEDLSRTAQILNMPEFEAELRIQLQAGNSYARSRQLALDSMGAGEKALGQPNNALGVDYLRRLMELGSPMEAMTIQRDPTMSAASDIRALILSGWCGRNEKTGVPKHTMEYGERAVLAVAKTLPDEMFEQVPFNSEGLWSKLMRACRCETSVDDIILACKSKRYTHSRLRRMLLCLFLGLTEADMERPVPYLRVLAFNDRGREILRRAGETSSLPLVSGSIPETSEAEAYFKMEARATDLYGLFVQPGSVEPCGREKTHPPVYLRPSEIDNWDGDLWLP